MAHSIAALLAFPLDERQLARKLVIRFCRPRSPERDFKANPFKLPAGPTAQPQDLQARVRHEDYLAQGGDKCLPQLKQQDFLLVLKQLLRLATASRL